MVARAAYTKGYLCYSRRRTGVTANETISSWVLQHDTKCACMHLLTTNNLIIMLITLQMRRESFISSLTITVFVDIHTLHFGA